METQFFEDLISLMDEKKFRNVIKDISASGFRKGKVPRKIIARMIPQLHEKDRKRFLSDVFSLYFPDKCIDSLELDEIQNDNENQPGVMAAYAYYNKIEEFHARIESASENHLEKDLSSLEEKNENIKELESDKSSAIEQSREQIQNEETYEKNRMKSGEIEEQNPHFQQGGNKKKMTYIGHISIMDTLYGLFYNFYPVAAMKNSGEIMSLDRYERNELFPTKGNINIRSKARDDAKLAEVFQDGVIYALDIDETVLEDNVRSDGELNITNYKVDIATLQARNAIHTSEEISFLPVIDYPGFKSKLEHDEIIQIPNRSGHDYSNENIVLRDGEYLVGPFLVTTATDGSLYVAPQSKKRNYVFDVYYADNNDNAFYSSQEVANIEITNILYVNLNKLPCRQEDYIGYDGLLKELNNIIKSKAIDDFSEKSILETAFLDLSIPSEIIKSRKEKVVELFKRQKNLNDMIKTLSENVNEVLVTAAQTNDSVFEKTFTELAKRDGFMLSIQKYRIISDEIEKKRAELQDLNAEKCNLENRIAETKQELENERLNVLSSEIEEKKKELNEVSQKLHDKTASLELVQGIEDLRVEKRYLERVLAEKRQEKKAIEEQTEAIMHGFDTHAKDIMSSVSQVVIQDQVAGIIADATRRSPSKHFSVFSSDNSILYKYYKEICSKGYDKECILDLLISRINKYRNYSRNDIINLFICVTQGFLTFFSGSPGTGKTSICSIIAHVLGIDSIKIQFSTEDKSQEKEILKMNRFVFVPVERGWSSKRDFIGYYNPLTKEFDKSNKQVFDALESTSAEQGSGVSDKMPPFVILLDEANLSPMEYYWADFMAACDRQDELSSINVGENLSFHISSSLRFLATINNDHTTESLSPRLVDRAWIISLPQPSSPSRIKYEENYDPISMDKLYETFGEKNESVHQLNPIVQEILKKVYGFCRDKLGIVISSRVEIAIKQYCNAGAKLFDNADNEIDPAVIAVDYAVAQKILPKIQGNGTEYKKRLDEFLQIMVQENLLKSADLLKKLIQCGDNNMQYYQFFA